MMENSKYKNLIKHIKNSLVFNISNYGSMFIFGLAVSKDDKKNQVQMIKFDSGISISSSVYDTYNDCFYARCEDYIFLGSIPLTITCHVEDNTNWIHKVPFSKNVLNKIIDKPQKKILRNFIKKYPEDTYKIEFLQLYNSRYK